VVSKPVEKKEDEKDKEEVKKSTGKKKTTTVKEQTIVTLNEGSQHINQNVSGAGDVCVYIFYRWFWV
jgi:hypothetical protein